jgi:quinol monooxygenase YgiN
MCSSKAYRSRRCRETESEEGGQMSELQLVARHTIAAGKENEVLPPLPKLAAAALAEPGCLVFEYRRLDDQRSYVLLERYASQEALDAHRETDHFKNLVPGEISGVEIGRLLVEFAAGIGGAGGPR